jgi:hypothetical protein
MNAKGVNALGDAEFVRDREIDAFTLRTVSQSRIVYFDLWFHHVPQKRDGISTPIGATLQTSSVEADSTPELPSQFCLIG